MSDDDRTADAGEDSGTKPLTTRKSPRIGKSFSQRNPLPIGAIGLVFLLLLIVAAFNAQSLPLIGGGTEYKATFNQSANLQQGDEVRIGGVRVGEVQSVSITGTKVLVDFTVKNGWVGNESTVYIKIKTLLGAKYLSIDSKGTAAQDPSKTMKTTYTPLDVYPAFTKVTDTIQNINTANLSKAFQTLATDFSGTPQYVKPVVTGLSRLSKTISSRDQKLGELLSSANNVTKTLAARDQDLTKLLSDGNLLLAELDSRSQAIHSLLINTQILSTQLRGLVSDNQKTLNPLLTSLDSLLSLLRRNSDSLERGVSLLGPFYRVFNNVIGNGRWFDNYIQNLGPQGILDSVLSQLPGNATGGTSATSSGTSGSNPVGTVTGATGGGN